MSALRKISSALISVWHKNPLEELLRILRDTDIQIYSTGGTADFIEQHGTTVNRIETVTGYPSILGGRVKTLHPKVFGGILSRRDNEKDVMEIEKYGIPPVDLVIVDLYPFGETVAGGAIEQEIIEKIDIGGISLIRAAAKNFNDVLVIPSEEHYPLLIEILQTRGGRTSLEERREMAGEAFRITSTYDAAIQNYFAGIKKEEGGYSLTFSKGHKLRYGENPHQEGWYYSPEGFPFRQLHGKEISYNNLLDIDAAGALISEFEEVTFGIIKHNNACGLASRERLKDAWLDAFAGDPVSAFGGVLVTNRTVDAETAGEIDKLFFEVIIAPGYDKKALETLKQKKNRIILEAGNADMPQHSVRSAAGGILVQERDSKTETVPDLKVVTTGTPPTEAELKDLVFANKIVKHSKSNAIVLAKERMLLGSGVGQTSRIDALKHAIAKAGSFGFDLQGAVMASDAFFPFADSVEIAYIAGISAVIQPGGSVRDQESIDFCNNNGMKMVFTGTRHFKH